MDSKFLRRKFYSARAINLTNTYPNSKVQITLRAIASTISPQGKIRRISCQIKEGCDGCGELLLVNIQNPHPTCFVSSRLPPRCWTRYADENKHGS